MASLYDQSIPVLLTYLETLTKIIKKAEDYASKEDSASDLPSKDQLLTHRLHPDMGTLVSQVQACSNACKFLLPRISGQPDTHLEDNETTFEQIYARIDRTIELLKTIDRDAFNKNATDKEIIITVRRLGSYKFSSKQAYISEYTLPNFHFHLSSAYCILRSLGVPLTLFDYLEISAEKVELPA